MNAVDMIVDDVDLIKMAQFFIYYDTRKMKRRLLKKGGSKRKADKEE